MGSVSIDVSVPAAWRSWQRFVVGKTRTRELEHFSYNLEEHLQELSADLVRGTYRHGGYRRIIIQDTKRRDISVASVRDRVVHRLLYQYLVDHYDHTFSYDVWSCRKRKGLAAAIRRTQDLLRRFPKSWVWRADVQKFFDSVDQQVLLRILARKVTDPRALALLWEVIGGYERERERERERESTTGPRGIPIGNLTSQVFANIYLNELDRLVQHVIKPLGYARYGDDFIILTNDEEELLSVIRPRVTSFLHEQLRLTINPNNDWVGPVRRGIHFLGVEIFPKGLRLKPGMMRRLSKRLGLHNVSSYRGLLWRNEGRKKRRVFDWQVADLVHPPDL